MGANFSFADKNDDQHLVIYNNANPRKLFSHSKSSTEFFVCGNSEDDEPQSPTFIDADLEKEIRNEKDEEDLLNLALVPIGGNPPPPYWNSNRSCLSSPVENGSNSGSKSCPTTPQMPRRKYLKEGTAELTSLATLCTHQRYFFLFNDLLLISKQK